MLEKFLTKDNVIIVIVAAVITFGFLIESNIFATKIELLAMKNDMLQMKVQLMQYSDQKDEAVLKQLDDKYEKILHKLDQLQKR